ELPGQRLAYRFSHELVRRALYDRLSALRKAESHLRVAEALERVHAGITDAVLLELPHHFTVAAPVGGDERVGECNGRAAEVSAAGYPFGQVEGVATAGFEFAAEGTALWARAQCLRATAEVNLARDGADEHAASAAAAFAALGDVEAAAEAEVLCARSLRNQRRPEADAAAARATALPPRRPPAAPRAAAARPWAACRP